MSNRRPDDATSLRFREYLPTLDTFYAERTEQLRRDAQQKKLELLQRAEQKKAELEQFAERERTERRRTLDRMLEDTGNQAPPAAAAALASRHASLTNLRVAFTGTLQLTRREAEALACAAGAMCRGRLQVGAMCSSLACVRAIRSWRQRADPGPRCGPKRNSSAWRGASKRATLLRARRRERSEKPVRSEP